MNTIALDLDRHPWIETLPVEWALQLWPEDLTENEIRPVDLARLRQTLGPESADFGITGIWERGPRGLLTLDATVRDARVDEDCSFFLGPVQDWREISRKVSALFETGFESETFCSSASTDDELEPLPSSAALELFAQAEEARIRGDLEEAKKYLEESLAVEPEHPFLLINHAEVAFDLGMVGESEWAAERALLLAQRLGNPVRIEVKARSHQLLGDWAAAAAAYRHLQDLGPNDAAALHEGELLTLLALQGAFLESSAEERVTELRRRLDGGIYEARADLADARRLLDEGKIQAARGFAQQAAGAGRSLGIPLLEADGLVLTAVADDRMQRFDEAFASLDRAEELLAGLGVFRGRLTVFMERAVILAQEDELHEARSLLERYRSHYLTTGGELNIAIVNVNLANVLRTLGEYEFGEELAEEARAIFRRRQLPREVALADMALGSIHFYMPSAMAKAKDEYRQALEVFADLGDRHYQGLAASNLAEVYYCQGEHSRADTLFQEARSHHRELQEESGVAYVSYWMAKIAIHLDDREAARSLLHRAFAPDELPEEDLERTASEWLRDLVDTIDSGADPDCPI